MAAIAVWVATWWLTEAVEMPVSADVQLVRFLCSLPFNRIEILSSVGCRMLVLISYGMAK